MKFFITPKTKKQEKIVKKFLEELDISFTVVEEDAAAYKTTSKKQFTKKEKQILDNLTQSVDFVKKYSQEKEDAAILKAMEKGKKTRLLKPGEKKAFLHRLKTAK